MQAHPRGPTPIHLTPERIFRLHRRTEVVDNVPPLERNCFRYLALSGQDGFRGRWHYEWFRMAEFLDFQDPAPFSRQREFYRELWDSFFDTSSSGPSLLALVPWRQPCRNRVSERTELTEHFDPARVFGPLAAARRRSLRIDNRQVIDFTAARFATHGRDCRLMQHSRIRQLRAPRHEVRGPDSRGCSSDRRLCSTDSYVYAHHPDGDDTDPRSIEFTSAMAPYRRAEPGPWNGAFTAPTITLARLERSARGCRVRQRTIGVDPCNGETVVVGEGERSLEMYCRLFADESAMLTRAAERIN